MLSKWPLRDEPKGWRQLGCELALAQQDSSPEKTWYYVVLAKVKLLIEAEMNYLRPEVGVTEEQWKAAAEPPPLPEKVADQTHKGPGL